MSPNLGLYVLHEYWRLQCLPSFVFFSDFDIAIGECECFDKKVFTVGIWCVDIVSMLQGLCVGKVELSTTCLLKCEEMRFGTS